MADHLSGDELGFDRVANNRAAGAIGGQARTTEKLAAVRRNIAEARVAKAYYRKHPEKHPSRRGSNDGGE